MFPTVSKSDFKKHFPVRKSDSHKGNHGRVLIIGGSRNFYGAPILSALGALYSGCDLVTLAVPHVNFEVSRTFYPDFIVRSYPGDFFNVSAFPVVFPLIERSDVCVIGPGFDDHEGVLAAVIELLKQTKKPCVLDAEAIFAVKDVSGKNKIFILTPHRREFMRLISKSSHPLTESPLELVPLVQRCAQSHNVTILLKAPQDIIVSCNGDVAVNKTGNPSMTVGGTGDVLSGVVGSFISQGLSPYQSCQFAAFLVGSTGDHLQQEKGNAFSATDLALQLPYVLQEIFR